MIALFKGFLERKTMGKFTKVHPIHKCRELDANIRKAWQNLLHRYENLLGKDESKKLTNDIFEAALKLQE